MRLEDPESKLQDPVCLAFDVNPDRSRASISAAGANADGDWHVEVVDYFTGTAQVVPRLVQLDERWQPLVIVCDAHGPAAALLEEATLAGLAVKTVTAGEHAQSWGRFVDAVNEGTIRHLGSLELQTAIRGARTRPLGDARAWSRRSSSVDISPLVAATLALGAAAGVTTDTEAMIY